MIESPTKYLGFIIWPVLNDDHTEVDYYDIHERGDVHGEGNPINTFGTRSECAAWIRREVKDLRFINALENMSLK